MMEFFEEYGGIIVFAVILVIVIIIGVLNGRRKKLKKSAALAEVEGAEEFHYKAGIGISGYFKGHFLITSNHKTYDLSNVRKLCFFSFYNGANSVTTYYVAFYDENLEIISKGPEFATRKGARKFYDVFVQAQPDIKLADEGEVSGDVLDIEAVKIK